MPHFLSDALWGLLDVLAFSGGAVLLGFLYWGIYELVLKVRAWYNPSFIPDYRMRRRVRRATARISKILQRAKQDMDKAHVNRGRY